MVFFFFFFLQGEEVTFDYNYVRVVGAAAKRCYCGSPQCQGYIGGDPTSSEVTDQVDSDEEFPEPVMLEDGEVGDGLKNKISKTSFFGLSKGREMESKTAVGNLEVATEIKDSMNQSTPAISQSPSESEMNGLPGDFSSSSKRVEISPQTEDMTTQPTPAVQQEISMEEMMDKSLYSSQKLKTSLTSVLIKPLPDDIMINRKSKSATAENKRVFVKSRFIIKTPPQSGLIKKGKSASNFININKVQTITNKPHMPPIKPKKLSESTSDGHFEAGWDPPHSYLFCQDGIMCNTLMINALEYFQFRRNLTSCWILRVA
jgi:histone-lysine N-methyltransferase SETD2